VPNEIVIEAAGCGCHWEGRGREAGQRLRVEAGKRRPGRWRPRVGWRLASGGGAGDRGVLKIRVFHLPYVMGRGARDQTAEIVYKIEWTTMIAERQNNRLPLPS
jgi:hypothetical protein